jgi:hypothetical protein
MVDSARASLVALVGLSMQTLHSPLRCIWESRMNSFWEFHSWATARARVSLLSLNSLPRGVFSLRWSRQSSNSPEVPLCTTETSL